MIYLDHAATTPMRDGVFEAMLPYLTSEFANASAAYGMARKNRRAIDIARGRVAALIGAQPSEIYFTSGGTESDNWAVAGGQCAAEERNKLVVSSIEHHAILSACEFLREKGMTCCELPVDKRGVVSLDAARALIDHRTAMVSVMLANNEVGTLQPVREIASLAHDCGALMHTDAVQAAGHIPIRVEEIGVDMLSMSAHKFGGPKGVGALYIKKGTRMDAFMHGGAQEKGMRPGTENIPAIVGMGYAALMAAELMEEESKRIRVLRDAMRRMLLESIPNVRINGDDVQCLPGHVHVSIPGRDASLLLARLDMEGVAASSASACAAGSIERSHVLRSMYPNDLPHADIRFTIGADNTMDEIERTVVLLSRMIED